MIARFFYSGPHKKLHGFHILPKYFQEEVLLAKPGGKKGIFKTRIVIAPCHLSNTLRVVLRCNASVTQ